MPMPACTTLRLAVTTIDPPSVMCRAACLIRRYGPVRLTSSTRDHSGDVEVDEPGDDPMPALANATSRRPKRSRRDADEPLDVGLRRRRRPSPSRPPRRAPSPPGSSGRGVEVAHDDLRALGHEPAGRRQADARGPAGDDRDLAGEATSDRGLLSVIGPPSPGGQHSRTTSAKGIRKMRTTPCILATGCVERVPHEQRTPQAPRPRAGPRAAEAIVDRDGWRELTMTRAGQRAGREGAVALQPRPATSRRCAASCRTGRSGSSASASTARPWAASGETAMRALAHDLPPLRPGAPPPLRPGHAGARRPRGLRRRLRRRRRRPHGRHPLLRHRRHLASSSSSAPSPRCTACSSWRTPGSSRRRSTPTTSSSGCSTSSSTCSTPPLRAKPGPADRPPTDAPTAGGDDHRESRPR